MIRQLVNAVRELLIKAVDPEANPDLAVLQEHVRHTDTVVIPIRGCPSPSGQPVVLASEAVTLRQQR